MATDWTSIWERQCKDNNGPICCKRKLKLRGLEAQDWDPTVWRWAWPLQSREKVGLLSRWIQRDPSGLAEDTRTHHCAQGGPSANKGRACCCCVITGGWYRGWEALRSQKTLFMASYSSLFVLGGSKITADGDCSHEIKRCLLLGRKVMTNLDSTFKSRNSTLPTKVCLVKAMVFPVVMYGCESWTVKKAEHQRINAFELWCWRRLLRVPCTARRYNQSILKEISPGCSLEGVMLKLRLQ